LGSIEKKLDTTICAAALLVVLALFIWISLAAVQHGLSSADDAFFAIVAKNVAVGKGYGLPRSNKEFVLYDQSIGTGPTLILPLAFLIWVFGWPDQLPGATALVIFISQLVVTAIVLSRRFGWAPTCGFLSAMLWLLMLANVYTFYFGAFLGEPAAYGFILIGTALLAVAKRGRAIVAASLCFALAFLTKQISLFAVAGVVGGWLIVSAYNREQRRLLLRRAAILVLAGSSLPLAFEAAKLVKLGMAGYLNLWKLTLKITSTQAIGRGNQSDRWTTFLSIFEGYTSLVLLAGLVIGSVILLLLSRRSRGKEHGSAVRFAVFAWTGAAAYLIYILMVSILWQRYFWIGIAVMVTAICAPLLAVESRLRVATLLVLLVGTLGFGLHRPMFTLRQWLTTSTLPAERAAVVRVLDAHPDLPYLAPGWSSLFDVLYLRREEGIWAYDPNAVGLQDGDFIALINIAFTNKQDRFLQSVVKACDPLTPQARLTAYHCGERFRSMNHFSASSSSSQVPLEYYGVVDRRDCKEVAGWVMKTADPNASVKVELYIDDKLVDTLPAHNLRPDLRGKGGTGRYGFSFEIPAAYKDERSHRADVKILGSENQVRFFEGVFSTFECKP
jgi:hypothetical protein